MCKKMLRSVLTATLTVAVAAVAFGGLTGGVPLAGGVVQTNRADSGWGSFQAAAFHSSGWEFLQASVSVDGGRGVAPVITGSAEV
jgi:hypothetical protein